MIKIAKDIIIPINVRQKAMNIGSKGEQWLNNLGQLLQLFEQRWNLQIGKSLHGGSEAFVAEVSTEDGEEAILKLMIPPAEGNTVFEQELTALTIVDGDGYVRLLNYSMNHRALLLEKLGTPLSNTDYPIKRQMEVICSTLKKTWKKPLPQDHKLQSSNDIINWFSRFIPKLWEELGTPCAKQLIDNALVFLESRSSNSALETSVLIHGDAHSGNILQDVGKPQPCFKLIDPDGLVAEPAYDLGVIMREWPDQLTGNPLESGHHRCNFLSEVTGVDSQAIWEWGYIQCVSTGLLLINIGLKEVGLQMLRIAESWSRG
ncbi:aminoglycoside phosphotransferase family protein [Gracilibacillus sp. HCP3S3_G5_1]|uniref:aminoglycoside phosphotransferase family protein n=1 Tax=unclassified Gracilibacillus TaxID=2625209 RepID=UPI003F8BD1E7